MSPPQQNGRHTTSNPRRALPAHTRPLRPPPLNPRKNSLSATSKKSPGGKSPTTTKFPHKREASTDTEDEGMAGLPQFCATCEKQITTPAGPSILYCSESCRRTDQHKPLSEAILPSASDMSPKSSSKRNSYFGDEFQHEILPMRSPTIVRPPSLAFSDDSSDSSSNYERYPSYRSNESEAFRYPNHFRRDSGEQDSRRLSYERAYELYSGSQTPSLSHTSASFISTPGSCSSTRPLPRRTNPYSASFSSLSVDLVTPVVNVEPLKDCSNSFSHQSASLRSSASTSTAFRTAEGEMSYEKKSCMHDMSPSKGSLCQLFSHEAMQAAPKPSFQLTTPCDSSENGRVHFEEDIF